MPDILNSSHESEGEKCHGRVLAIQREGLPRSHPSRWLAEHQLFATTHQTLTRRFFTFCLPISRPRYHFARDFFRTQGRGARVS